MLPDLPELAIAERHLGLTPLEEAPDLAPIVERIGAAVARHLDLDRIEAIARSAPPLAMDGSNADLRGSARKAVAQGGSIEVPRGHARDHGRRRVRIGIAMDRAFTFYYPENLEALIAAGAELVPFSPLEDPRLPPVDGLYIGGGFPEVFMERLEANATMREDVRRAIAAGVPAWAECGGLMYLTQGISWRGRRAAMAGVVRLLGGDGRPARGPRLRPARGDGERRLAARRAAAAGARVPPLAARRAAAAGKPSPIGRCAATGRSGDSTASSGARASPGYTHLHADGAPWWAADFVALIRARGARFDVAEGGGRGPRSRRASAARRAPLRAPASRCARATPGRAAAGRR